MALAGAWLLFQGDIVSGVWLGAIAWFLYSAASASVQQVAMEARLGRVRVRDLVQPIEVTAPPGVTVNQLIEQYMLPHNLRAVAVTDNSRLVGIVTVSDVIKVPEARRDQVSVAEIMGSGERLVTVSGETPALDAIELLAERDVEQVPVVDGSQLIGMLTRADVMRQLQLRESLSPR